MKEFDVIVWGATGFTGRLVAEYLNKTYKNGELKWAMGARNANKLREVQEITGTQSIPSIIANSDDFESLSELCSKAKVVCTTVGPYAKYGSKLVKACVENGTHYCDLAGEAQWIRKMIDEHHEQAKANGVKIVHCCGFDSIPSDMGVHFTQEEFSSRFGKYAQDIKFYVRVMKGKFSGGTLASMQYMMEEAGKDKSIYKILTNPYGLNPKGEEHGPDKRDLVKPVYDENIKSWLGPFVMAGINTKIVRRSHAIQNYPYGQDFTYSETTATGDGLAGRMRAYGLLMTLGFAMAMKPGSIAKGLGDRFLPKPGEGPNKQERDNGFYKIMLKARSDDGHSLTTQVTGDNDPGYGSTSKMLGESAVCLAKDDLPEYYGCITPSTAMGSVLRDRLVSNSGLTFKVLS